MRSSRRSPCSGRTIFIDDRKPADRAVYWRSISQRQILQPVLPFFRLGSFPDQQQVLNRSSNQEHAGAVVARCKLPEVLGHRADIMRNNNAGILGGQQQDGQVIQTLKPGRLSRPKID